MKVFLFILDGCSVAEFKKASTPFLDKMSQEGKMNLECKAIFPTATYTGHSTIITGNYPEKHGMIGNQFYDRKSRSIRNFDFYNPNENILSPTIFEILPFSTCAICEPVTKGAIKVVEKRIVDKESIERQNHFIFNQIKQVLTADFQFYMVNFQGVDGIGEMAGPNSQKYLDTLQEVDRFIAETANQIHSDFIFLVTADHGMTTVEKNVDLEELLVQQGFQVKCLASHRMSHIYTDSKLEELERYLRNLPCIDRVFNSADLRKVHLAHERTGDLVVSAKKGFELGNNKLKGSHGGSTSAEMEVPFIIYESQKNIINEFNLNSMSLIDICPTLLNIFNIKPRIQFQGKSLLKNH